MEERLEQPVFEKRSEDNEGCMSELTFLFKGFLYPCGSGSFYKEMAKKKLITAIFFFIIFAFVITFVSTIQVAIAVGRVGNEISGSYERGEFPTIIIQDGVAQVDGPQPFVLEDNRNIFAIDTTGGMEEIDTHSYSQGLLLTRSELHVLSKDGYQVLPLADLHEPLGNPIVVDKTQVLDLWKTASFWIDLATFIGLLIWNSLIRLMYITFLGLIMWGVVSMIRAGTGFSPILITGIFASVPAAYLKFVLKLININFLSLYTIILIIIWGFALRIVLKGLDEEKIIHTEVSGIL